MNDKDIVVGQPIPWSLYTEQYSLLLSEGDVVRDEKHRSELLANGAYRELTWEQSSTTETTQSTAETADANTPFTFEDMRLKVEDRLQLEPPSQLSSERFAVKVIGYLKGVSLLVTAPIGADGLRVLLKEKDNVIMRSFSGISAFAFACTIKRIVNVPFGYLHLSFPEVIQGIKIRKTPRVKTNIITVVQNASAVPTTQKSAVISDISTDGVSLVSAQSLGNKGDILQLAFRVQIHNVDAYLTVNGVIRAVTSDNESGAKTSVLHGIQFQDLQPNDCVVLQSMIYQQMIENPQKVI